MSATVSRFVLFPGICNFYHDNYQQNAVSVVPCIKSIECSLVILHVIKGFAKLSKWTCIHRILNRQSYPFPFF